MATHTLQSMLLTLVMVSFLRVTSTSWCKGGSMDCWRNRMIYQVITDRFARVTNSDLQLDVVPCPDLRTYCGGTFRGILSRLDYIQGLGAEAIWIDPVTANSPGGYMGFWPISLTRINPHFGTAEDFKALVDELHRRGMLIMIGLTANSMGHYWSEIPLMDPPFNDTAMYNDCKQCRKYGGGVGGVGCNGALCDCWIGDYDSVKQDTHCQLYGLPDVNQDNPVARNALLSYARDIVKRFDIDGVRLDAVPYMPVWFWKEFSRASGVLAMGEVEKGDDMIVSKIVSDGIMTSILNYPLYYQLLNVFTLANAPGDQSSPTTSRWGVDSLPKYYAMQKANYGDAQDVLGNFVSNHDQARLDCVVKDPMLKLALTLTMLTWVGMPIVYYGLEQELPTQDLKKYSFDSYRSPLWERGYPTDSPWYRWIGSVGQLRKRLPREDFADSELVALWSRPDALLYTRGRVLVAVSNGGENWPDVVTPSVKTSWSSGTTLCSAFDVADCITVDDDRSVKVVLLHGESKLYAPADVLEEVHSKKEEPMTLIM